jgi:protein ImuA
MRNRASPALDEVRARIAALEAGRSFFHGHLPFGLEALDARLAGGGLALGALHEVAGGGNGAVDGAAAALFAAGILARTSGPVLWCVTRRDLFAPAIAQAGLHPDRVIYADVGDEKTVLACFEEGLRHGGLAGVVGEVTRLSMPESRRLQLAAEASGTLGLALRRWRRMADAADFGQPTASVSRWRVSALPSSMLPVPGVGRPRWLVELIRARAGLEAGTAGAGLVVESCDETGRLAVPAALADGPSAAGSEHAAA